MSSFMAAERIATTLTSDTYRTRRTACPGTLRRSDNQTPEAQPVPQGTCGSRTYGTRRGMYIT